MINRGVVIVRPKQPFLDWAAGLDDSELLPDVDGEQTVYLVPEFATPEDANSLVELLYPAFFENELYTWFTDESAWPERRDLETFREWFSIEFHSVVEDLCDYEIIDDEDDADAFEYSDEDDGFD